MGWNEIRNDEDIRRLNELYGYFEDSVIVSMSYRSGDFVDKELMGHMEMKNDLRVVFQRLDNDPFSIELWFKNTRRMNFEFINPSDECVSDIMDAKVCKNDSSFFWTIWKDFDPYDPEHFLGTVLIESEKLSWRVVTDKVEDSDG